MKKFLLLLSGAFFYATGFAQVGISLDSLYYSDIDLRCHLCDHYEPVKNGNPKGPRTPVLSPTVYISEHSLLFICGCDNTKLAIYDLAGNEVYSTLITEGTESLTLPEWLEGTYELHIHRGNFCFYGEIEL